jgi:Calcineurin-like phosphoesterase
VAALNESGRTCDLVAVVVHVTDLHLFLDEHGNQIPARDAGRVISSLRSLGVSGLERHDSSLWIALQTRLPQIVLSERSSAGENVPIVVLQTGDVEAYGMGGAPSPFAGFKAWKHDLWPALRAAGADRCIDLFGNHDLWDRTLPLVSRRGATSVLERLRASYGMNSNWPERFDFQLPNGGLLEIYRLNSVALGRARAFLAGGALSPLPTGGRRGRATRACSALQALGGRYDTEKPAIRIVAMHHPPHAFAASWAQRVTNCNVRGAKQLGTLASRLPIHLVIAGHRHALDPLGRLPRSPRLALQEPLPGKTVQLVAESPTQPYRHSDNGERGRNSMSVYRLFVDDKNELSARRVLYSARNARGPYPGDNFHTDDADGDLVLHQVPL